MSKQARTAAEFRLNAVEFTGKIDNLIRMNFILITVDNDGEVTTVSTMPSEAVQTLIDHTSKNGFSNAKKMTKGGIDNVNPSSN